MNRFFRLLLISLCVLIGYLGVKYALETKQTSDFRNLPFVTNHSINIANQVGVVENGKLFLICEKDNSLRLIYKARLPVKMPSNRKIFKFNASLLFSKKNPSSFKSSEVDFIQPVIFHSEKDILFDWLTTIFTEPLTRNEYSSITKLLTSKTYKCLSFFGMETGTYFTFDEKYLNHHLPPFERNCENY